MLKRIKSDYQHTLYACFIGYIVQAIVNNFLPLLFVTLGTQYGISMEQISILIFINFGVQLTIDLLSAKFVDRIGYRKCIITAHLFSGLGLAGLALFPSSFKNEFIGILFAVILYAIGGGLLEVLISPIVESCPTKRKEAAMSLLHSFYCWGYAGVIVLSTLFFATFGISNWKILSILWAFIPFANLCYFFLVPISALKEEKKEGDKKKLFQNPTFWLFFALMLCAGASEQAISQWTSAFAEKGLGVNKTIGDLTGPLMFAILMGSARVFYSKFSEKFRLERYMLFCGGMCTLSYLLASLTKAPLFALFGCALCGFSVGVFWPGTFSMATRELRDKGTALFGFLALAGDLGCSVGPALVGVVADYAKGNIKLGILSAIIFPVLLIGCLIYKEMYKNT